MSPRDEGDLLGQTIELAQRCRWAVAHFRPARTERGWRTAMQGHKGFPDLVLAKVGVVLFRELKGSKGVVSPEQRDWAQQLMPGWVELRHHIPNDETRLLFDVWRPEHWETRIIPVLTSPTTTPLKQRPGRHTQLLSLDAGDDRL